MAGADAGSALLRMPRRLRQIPFMRLIRILCAFYVPFWLGGSTFPAGFIF